MFVHLDTHSRIHYALPLRGGVGMLFDMDVAVVVVVVVESRQHYNDAFIRFHRARGEQSMNCPNAKIKPLLPRS